jgi:predicted XRE-type DNA-binding protein
MKSELDVLRGTGNVFVDLGDAKADMKQLKAQLAAEIIGTLNRQGLSVRQGAKLAHVDPADIQRIRNADLSRFTVDRLLRVAFRLWRHVRVEFVPVQSEVAA